MQCLECGSENVKTRVTTDYDVPLAARNGSIKVGGIKPSQLDLKTSWEKQRDGSDHRIRGPIFCHDCGTEHYYVVETKTFKVGSTVEAREALGGSNG